MPGLVGVTFRSGGPLSVFRSSITHQNEEATPGSPDEGMVTLKLFNLLVSEMGPNFLERGIWLKIGIIKTIIEEEKASLQTVFKKIIIDGREIGTEELDLLKWHDSQELIHVIVRLKK